MVEEKERKPLPEGTFFIGSKPLMIYVSSVVMQFTTKNIDKVELLSRGLNNARAIDVAEVVKRTLEIPLEYEVIEIGSDDLERDGKTSRRSTLKIVLKKQ